MARYLYVGTENPELFVVDEDGGIVAAGGGSDIIIGGSARDILRGGSGRDIISGGDGRDFIRGDSGNDTLIGNAGNDVLIGDSGNDDIRGGTGNDYIVGGTGDDTLSGGTGSDTFIFGDNSGNDVVTDFTVGEDTIDLSLLSTAIAFEDLTITDLDDGSGVTVTHSALGGTITLQGVTSAELTADDFNLPTGSSTTVDDGDGTSMEVGSAVVDGTDAAEFIVDTETGTRINAEGGDDIVLAGEGDDTIDGGGGHDLLLGEEGDDTIHGGAGDDDMFGGEGADTFVFKAGHGDDAIHDFTTGEDTIRIDTNGLTGVTGFADLAFEADGDDVVISTGDAGGTIRIENISIDDLDTTDFTFYDSSTDPDGF